MEGPPGQAARPEPAGFGNCPQCAYAATGTPEICSECAQRVLDPLPKDRCLYCDGALRHDGCANPLCSWPKSQRGWNFIYALAQRRGVLERVINTYKYRNVEGWAWIFGRLLSGFLVRTFETPYTSHQVIIPMPTYVGLDGRSWDHTALVLERAQKEDSRWPFAFDVMRKTGPTPHMVNADWRERQRVATYDLAPLLAVDDPARVAGKSVLVYDDVFTSGTTMRIVALKLLEAGAREVDAVVLARQPFRD